MEQTKLITEQAVATKIMKTVQNDFVAICTQEEKAFTIRFVNGQEFRVFVENIA